MYHHFHNINDLCKNRKTVARKILYILFDSLIDRYSLSIIIIIIMSDQTISAVENQLAKQLDMEDEMANSSSDNGENLIFNFLNKLHECPIVIEDDFKGLLKLLKFSNIKFNNFIHEIRSRMDQCI